MERLLRCVSFLYVVDTKRVGTRANVHCAPTKALAVSGSVNPLSAGHHILLQRPFEDSSWIVVTSVGEVHFISGRTGDLWLIQIVAIRWNYHLRTRLLRHELSLLYCLFASYSSLLSVELCKRLVVLISEVR